MMLNKRPAEYYLFITWTITAPLLTLVWEEYLFPKEKTLIFLFKVLTITNFLNTAPLRDGAAGGFDAYEYPRWTEILGWLIFVCCNISIPLVFILTYIQQYRSILSYRKVGDFDFHSNFAMKKNLRIFLDEKNRKQSWFRVSELSWSNQNDDHAIKKLGSETEKESSWCLRSSERWSEEQSVVINDFNRRLDDHSILIDELDEISEK